MLATSGTIAPAYTTLIVPDGLHQRYVMEAIYGERGVKAGYVDGACKEAPLRALAHLAKRGATVVILGCTELPLILEQHRAYRIGAQTVALLDPTDLLARYCVAVALAS